MGIVIFANKQEYTVIKVMDYLFKNKVDCIHINEDDRLKVLKISVKTKEFKVILNDIREIDLYNVVLWNRNSSVLKKCLLNTYIEADCNSLIKQFYLDELTILSDYILKSLSRKRIFGTQLSSSLNKLLALDLAKSIGFYVPEFVTCGDFLYTPKWNGITKSLSEIYQDEDENFLYLNYSKSISFKNEEVGEFFPSLVQERIDKEADIRVYVFHKEVFACLIYTDRSNVDFRMSYDDKDIRYLPFHIDTETKNKISRLMLYLKLDNASIDFLVDKNAKLYFLEINPEGQFGFIDYYCNYGITDRIGEKLLQMHKEQ